jgi:hypothetical protein
MPDRNPTLSVRRNWFHICSACDKIVSEYVQHMHAIIFKKYSKIPHKMQILTINNRNFEKPSRNPSHRSKVKILKKKNFWIAHQKNLVPLMISHRRNVRTSKFWRKSKIKKRNFIRKFTKGI